VIIDMMSKHIYYAEKMGFRKWQVSLLENLLDWHTLLHNKVNLDRHIVKSINMGPKGGHTYFARAAACKSFPIKTKVYVSDRLHLREYIDLILETERCHHIVDILHQTDFTGYHDDPVDIVVIDMNKNRVEEYRQALSTLLKSLPFSTSILLLQVGNIMV